jgi:hypothetical protein
MKYNRALDWTALALKELSAGNTTLAAKLMVKASQEPSLKDAIRIVEASNKQAYVKLEASKKAAVEAATKTRLKASEEEAEEEVEEDVEQDPLDEIEDEEDEVEEVNEEEDPAEAMASVLASMTRRSKK